MLKIDKKTIQTFLENDIKKIKVFFYEAGCSWTKVNISSDFEITDELIHFVTLSLVEWAEWIKVYIPLSEKEKFDWAIITRSVVADHTWKEKIRYIFSNPKVLDRCGCGTSFSFEKKVPKINLEKLRLLKDRFGK